MEKIEKDYCDYETCVALRELGFRDECFGHYYKGKFYTDMPPKHYQSDRYISVPSLYEAQKWLRENHNLHVEVGYNPVLSWYVYRVWEHQDEIAEGEAFPSYEEALSTAIYMAIEYLKEGK